MPATTDLLLLDCETCRHRFMVRRSVASMVQVFPSCRHFVVPPEREVRPAGFRSNGPPAPIVVQVAPGPSPVLVCQARIVNQIADPVDFIGRFVFGFIVGAGAVFDLLLLLPLRVLGFSVLAFLVVELRVLAGRERQ